jgi:hypothetical protein
MVSLLGLALDSEGPATILRSGARCSPDRELQHDFSGIEDKHKNGC